MKELRGKVIEMILDLMDRYAKTGDERFKLLADKITRAWTTTFGDFNDPTDRF